MKKNLFKLWMLALPLLFGLASCSDDHADSNPLVTQVSGLWWSLIDQDGTIQDGQIAYTRIGQVLCFKEDGTGYGITFYFNDEESDPIKIIGGEMISPFTYTSTADGSIRLHLDNGYFLDPDYYNDMTLTYTDGAVTASTKGLNFILENAGSAMAAKIQEWDYSANGGASAKSYNPNDVDFNHDTWREQEAIYLYDGIGPETDDRGKKGYTLVNLPWYKGGVVESNLPMNFCDNITPENGWDLVMNFCGDNSTRNANFFALYNKWTGILRIFTYVPQGFQAGNDHMWRITTSGQTALYQGLPYGMPIDMTPPAPSAINLDINGATQYVSPWAENRASDGLLTPNAGWWAFDMDMSQYRPNLDISNDHIRLQMCSWNKQQASFISTLTASLDGSFKGDYKVTENPKASTMRATSQGLQAAFSAAGVFLNIASGQFGLAATSMSSFIDHAFNCGMEAGGINDKQTSVSGTINLTMNGNIDTHGLISGSSPVVGVSSPTLPVSKFDTKNTLLGKGVWNLKTSPVVWLTSASANFDILGSYWRDKYPDMYYEINDGGWRFCSPNRASLYFFDPSSIEVELNPDLFPAADIEYTQVDAYCVSRADNGVRGTDNYRKAFGLQPRCQGGLSDATGYTQYTFGINKEVLSENRLSWQLDFDRGAHAYDFFYYMDEKPEYYSYPAIVSRPKYEGGYYKNGYYDAVVGSGKTSAMAFEPMVLIDGMRNTEDNILRIPALEVMVAVTVKLRSKQNPLVYVRHYLPEVKQLWVGTMGGYDLSKGYSSVWQNLKARQPKGSGLNRQSPVYDYEMLRIGKLLEHLHPDFKAE